MPEGVGYGPQFTASTGLTLNYIGKHCYGISGVVSVNNNETSLLEFQTSSEYIKGKIQMTCASDTGEDTRFKIYFNNVIIFQYGMDNTGEYGGEEDPDQPVFVIVPPFTSVKITAMNSSSSASINQVAIMTGRLYGKVD